MKVLIVHDYAGPQGGAEVMTLALRDGLRRRGHDARVFASRAGTTAEPREADFGCFGTTSRWRTLLQTANPAAMRALARALSDFRPAVVHVRMFLTQLSPLILPLLRRVPSLYHAVWYRAVCPLGTKLLPDGSVCRSPWGRVCLAGGCLPARDWVPLMGQMQLWRRWRSVFDTVVANSESVRARLLEDGFTGVELIPNGVPPRPPRPELGPPLVAFAGRLVREKGPQVLLEAFARLTEELPEARLVLAGEGPLRGTLERRVGELGLAGRIELVGRLPRREMERRFDAAWVQAAPALWEEPFGNAVSEAMMRGTAVVATDLGEPAELVREGVTGFRVPPGDPGRLAGALRVLLSDRDLAERMGSAGREHALAELSEERWLDRFEEVYGRLTARGAGGGRGDGEERRPPSGR